MDLDRLKINHDENSPAPAKGRTSLFITLILGFIIGLVTGSLLFFKKDKGTIKVRTAVAGVTSARTSGKVFSAGGWIEVAAPEYPIVVSARVAQRLDTLLVKQGDSVKPGQILARLYDADIRSRLDLAAAKNKEQTEKLRLARANWERSSKLAKGAISEEDLDRDQAEFRTAEALQSAAAAEHAIARRNLDYCSIIAPTNFPELRVLDIFHKQGDWIPLNEHARILSLYDPSRIQVRVDVSQSNIRFAGPGQKVRIQTEANQERSYSGTVLRIEPLAELAKNTVRVRISVDDPDSMLFPEMVAHVTFVPEKSGTDKAEGKGEIILPADAVFKEGKDSYVYLFRDGIAQRRKVKTGAVSDEAVFVTEGLRRGERVIINNLSRLADGMEVEAD